MMRSPSTCKRNLGIPSLGSVRSCGKLVICVEAQPEFRESAHHVSNGLSQIKKREELEWQRIQTRAASGFVCRTETWRVSSLEVCWRGGIAAPFFVCVWPTLFLILWAGDSADRGAFDQGNREG
ncbi:hypothetical protein BSKO_01164 [Bryopsis sp. KO-2023]|nr:hypothetical protein BSKO_01164 [Bryopsis sp. KO-2023]